MVEVVRGDPFDSEAEAYVNAVNCVGVMGKGIALQFKRRYPDNLSHYKAVCATGDLRPGTVSVYQCPSAPDIRPRFIISFPTKDDWRNPSRMEWIQSGLVALTDAVRRHSITSVAIPALGCDNGGLDWVEDRPVIESSLRSLATVRILLHEPYKQPIHSSC
jgi:O-acetyl-ADP-ribose deacetylase (regulator of RNase III)